jgi:hypothetical protein
MFFKILNEDGSAYHGGNGFWSLPTKNDDGAWRAGDWMPAIAGELVPWKNGYHLCREKDLPRYLGPAIFEAEYRGEMIEAADKIVVREARLLRRFENWNERTAQLFACDCAEAVVHLCGDDPRPRQAIDVARRYANGEATDEELAAARDAARAAVRDAPMNAPRDAAWAATRAATRDAAWDMVWDMAWDAAWAAARGTARAAALGAALGAARGTARAIAWDAAWTATWTAAWDAQVEMLLSLLTA